MHSADSEKWSENKFSWIQLANHSKSISNQIHLIWKNSICPLYDLDLSKRIFCSFFDASGSWISFSFSMDFEPQIWFVFFSQANLAIRTFTIHRNATCDCWVDMIVYELVATKLKSAKNMFDHAHACMCRWKWHTFRCNESRRLWVKFIRVSCVRLLPKPLYFISTCFNHFCSVLFCFISFVHPTRIGIV